MTTSLASPSWWETSCGQFCWFGNLVPKFPGWTLSARPFTSHGPRTDPNQLVDSETSRLQMFLGMEKARVWRVQSHWIVMEKHPNVHMCVLVYVYIYISMYIYMYIYIYTYMHIHLHVHVDVDIEYDIDILYTWLHTVFSNRHFMPAQTSVEPYHRHHTSDQFHVPLHGISLHQIFDHCGCFFTV
jgi:hypothetical protein